MHKILLAVTALFASSISISLPTSAALPKKASAMVQPAEFKELADQLSFPGRVKSRLSAAGTSEIEGQVIRLEKNLGSKVKKGDVILVLQNTDPVYRYAPIKMRSPSDGYLTALGVDLLEKVERGKRLFTITDPQNLLVEIEIPASDLRSIKSDMVGEFKPDIQSSETLKVVIEGLSPMVDINTGTATARLRPLEKLNLLSQGQLGQFTLKTNARQAFLLPESALQYRDNKPYVRIINAGKIVKIPVELGPRMGDSFEVKSGIKTGEQIVLRTSRFVAEGEEVEIEQPKKENL